MAKGRKLTISRSERFLYGYNHGQGTAEESPELRDDDLWSMVNHDETMINGSAEEWTPHADANGFGAHRNMPRGVDRHVGGLSLAFNDGSGKGTSSSRIIHQFLGQESPHGQHVATSAPVNVPDWSKIYRADSIESLQDSEGVDDNEYEMVPPHEYLAREYRKMAANSVLEGVGRTLKGRDMSRVRDAVWSQTGFYG